MSANPSDNGYSLEKIITLVFLGMMLVAFPVSGYVLGYFIGNHMAFTDVQQGYAYGGLLYTIYKATHNPFYMDEANVTTAFGITLAQSDVTTLELFGLVFGLLLDVPVAIRFHQEYKKL